MVAHDLTGRLMIQCALQPGLAAVFSHILSFTKNEFYFKNFPELSRRRFADVCFMFDDAVPFGIHFCRPRLWTTLMDKPDQGEEKYCKIWINPRGDTLLDEDDEIIVIAEDDNSYQIGELNMVDPLDVPEFDDPDKGKTVNILLVGFRRDLD